MPDDAQQLPTLSDDDRAALQHWVREQGIGSSVTDVEPLTGGTQNIVVRVRVDGRSMVLRRPPLHPRPTSDKTMLREIAALRTLAGTPVPHPGFIAGCDDLNVLGVVFYLMEEIDGFNPGSEMDEAYVRDPEMRRTILAQEASPRLLEVLPPVEPNEPPKGMAEIVMIPVIPALLNAIFDATGHRFQSLPVTQAILKRALE